MRSVLVLGGTGWLGREIVRQLIEDGADVTCLARGDSGAVPPGAHHVRVDRTAGGAYDGVRRAWDEVIELAYTPELVGPAVDALAADAAHWTLVSSVSVYDGDDQPDADETASLVEPLDLSAYADAKVAAERTTAARLNDRLTIVRPGLIVGPGDPSDRFGYWAARFGSEGPVLVPHVDGRFVQVIDVADLAAWIVRAGRDGHVGTVDAVGPALPMRDFIEAVIDVAGYTGEVVAAGDDELVAHDIRYWAGPRSLPLWLPESDAAFARRSGRALLATGGRVRPLRDTLAAVLADERARGVDRPRRSGLTVDEEATVLRALR